MNPNISSLGHGSTVAEKGEKWISKGEKKIVIECQAPTPPSQTLLLEVNNARRSQFFVLSQWYFSS